MAAWLSHKSWPATELTLTNVCCYQNEEELQEVDIPCKFHIFQSLGYIICPWIAHEMQTPPEWLYCSTCYRSSQATLEFITRWVGPGQLISPCQLLTHSPPAKCGAIGRAKAGQLVSWGKDSLVSERKMKKKIQMMQKRSFTLSTPMSSQSSSNSCFGKTTFHFSLLSTISCGMRFLFGQFRSAVLIVSPSNILLTASLLRVRNRENLDTAQALFSNS